MSLSVTMSLRVFLTEQGVETEAGRWGRGGVAPDIEDECRGRADETSSPGGSRQFVFHKSALPTILADFNLTPSAHGKHGD